MVQAAVGLHIDVTAAGVNTAEIAARVIQLGCRFGQGSLFSTQVPGAAMPALLRLLGTTPLAARAIAA
jgi:EAL domain-containing protein (putative c-di-GMP-specific phosphodiesterase class I)